MGMTMTQKIFAAKAGRNAVQAGELLECNLDLVFANDITAPVAITEFNKLGIDHVFDPTKVALIPDHFQPAKDIHSAQLSKTTREFAKKTGCVYFEIGRVGVEHTLLPDEGFIRPGMVIIGADSHTCTHGALGAFATGVGSTDMAMGMATGTAWFRVPEAIKVTIKGKKRPDVSGKDVILNAIGQLGVDGARYCSLEFTGAIGQLTMADRLTISNMGIEAGAKNAIFPVDEQTLAFLDERAGGDHGQIFSADADASYLREIVVDLDVLEPTVAFPHLPENAKPISEATAMHIRIDQAVIGSCTNGRFEDMKSAADILRGRKIADDVRCIVIPATQEIWKRCVDEGLMDVFVDAGCAVSTPSCGPCLGGYMGILAEGERCVSTTNRNFVGRMGHITSEIYLASPAIAAASAVKGELCGPDSL